MREILTTWTTPSGGGHTTVMYLDDAVPIAPQRAGLATFFGAVDGLLDTSVSWTIATDGREIDETSGTLTGAWSDATAQTGSGASSGQAVPDAAQILFRWATNSVVNGRFVKGHTYVPGLSSTFVSDGNIAAAQVTTLTTAAAALVANTAVNLGVWHRPTGGSGGNWLTATGGTVWSEFAVLRRRRG